MVAGTLLARHAAQDAHALLAGFGPVQLVGGGVMLIWARPHYERLHGRLCAGEPVTHPQAARWIGRSAVAAAAVSLALALLLAIAR